MGAAHFTCSLKEAGAWSCNECEVKMGRRGIRELEREEMSEWQPIETAPKDGTPFLAGKSRKEEINGRWWVCGRNHV